MKAAHGKVSSLRTFSWECGEGRPGSYSLQPSNHRARVSEYWQFRVQEGLQRGQPGNQSSSSPGIQPPWTPLHRALAPGALEQATPAVGIFLKALAHLKCVSGCLPHTLTRWYSLCSRAHPRAPKPCNKHTSFHKSHTARWGGGTVN